MLRATSVSGLNDEDGEAQVVLSSRRLVEKWIGSRGQNTPGLKGKYLAGGEAGLN